MPCLGKHYPLIVARWHGIMRSWKKTGNQKAFSHLERFCTLAKDAEIAAQEARNRALRGYHVCCAWQKVGDRGGLRSACVCLTTGSLCVLDSIDYAHIMPRPKKRVP